jgi:hypothetical protein
MHRPKPSTAQYATRRIPSHSLINKDSALFCLLKAKRKKEVSSDENKNGLNPGIIFS